MKNLTELPQSIKIKDIINDYSASDYTTSLSLTHKSHIDLCISKKDIDSLSDTFINKCFVNRFIPHCTDTIYNNHYKYWSNINDSLVSYKYITNDYPVESWYPTPHTDSNIGPDGTISINDTNPVITLTQLNDLTKAISRINGTYYTYRTYVNIKSVYEQNDIVNKQDVYNLINTVTLYDHLNIFDPNYQYSKYGTSIAAKNEVTLATTMQVPNHLSYEYTMAPSILSLYSDENFYIYYREYDTKRIVVDNKLLKYELEYVFNTARQINTISGFLFNVINKGITQSAHASGTNDETQMAANECSINNNCLTLSTDITSTVNKNVYDENYSTVYLTVLGLDESLNEWVPMGYRSLRGPDVVELETMLPILPRKVKAIKLVVQEKLHHTPNDLPPDSTAVMGAFRDLKGLRFYSSQYINDIYYGITNSDMPLFRANIGISQFNMLCGCSKFLPGFNVELTDSNINQYHTLYDTRNFVKFKAFETQAPSNLFINGMAILSSNDYYPYLYDVSYNGSLLSFKVNENHYKHSDVLSNSAIDSIDIQRFTYDYTDNVNINDSTVIDSTNITDISGIHYMDISSLNDETFVNIKINYNPSNSAILNNISNLTTYISDYNNYEYGLKLPNKNNIKKIYSVDIYRYDVDSTTNLTVTKNNTNYILCNKNINSFILDNTNGTMVCNIQVTQIGTDGILFDKWINGTTYIDNYSDIVTSTNLVDGTNVVTLPTLSINPLTHYIMITITTNDNNWANNFSYSSTKLFNVMYTIPYTTETQINPISFDTTLLSDDVFHYKLHYTTKV